MRQKSITSPAASATPRPKRGRPPKGAGSRQLTIEQLRAVEVELAHARTIKQQTGRFELAAAAHIARALGVTRRAVERWRKMEGYEFAITAGELKHRGAARDARREKERRARQPVPLTFYWDDKE